MGCSSSSQRPASADSNVPKIEANDGPQLVVPPISSPQPGPFLVQAESNDTNHTVVVVSDSAPEATMCSLDGIANFLGVFDFLFSGETSVDKYLGLSANYDSMVATRELSRCDAFTKYWVGLGKLEHAFAVKQPDPPPDMLKMVPRLPTREETEFLELKFLKYGDADHEKESMANRMSYELLVKSTEWENNDKLDFVNDREKLTELIMAEFGKTLKPSEIQWDDWYSLKTLRDISFAGLGQWYVTVVNKIRTDGIPVPPEAVYEIDVTFLSKYKFRDNYEELGAIAYFSADRTPIGIWLCNKKRFYMADDAEFDFAQMIYRISLMWKKRYHGHMIGSHWVLTEGLVIAIEKNLDVDHPIRRLLRPHTFGMAEINRLGWQVIWVQHRAQAVHKDDWLQSLREGVDTFKVETYDEHFASTGLPPEMLEIMPLYKDGIEFWNITLKYVTSYVDIFYKTDGDVLADEQLKNYWREYETRLPRGNKAYQNMGSLNKANLVKHLTWSLFYSTGDHTFQGHLEEYLLDPVCASSRFKGQMFPSVQHAFLDAAFICLTSLPQPRLLNDFSFMHDYPGLTPDKKVKVITAMNEWQADLRQQAEVIDARNQERITRGEQPFDKFNPRIMDCNVAV